MMKIDNTRSLAWCELVVAYGWLKGDADLTALSKRLPAAANDSLLSRMMEEDPKSTFHRRCEEVLRAAGITLLHPRRIANHDSD